MATVNNISNGEVIWESTDGNVITFRITGDINLDSSDTCVKESHNPHSNTNFPADIPELHFHIVHDGASGGNTVPVSETIEVTMDDINEPVAVTLVVKEGDTTKKTATYHENPASMRRPIFNRT